MHHTDGTSTRRPAVRKTRAARRTAGHQRNNGRRFAPKPAAPAQERDRAQSRARDALREIGVLIQLRLILRDGIPAPATRKLTQTLRRAGFIVWQDHDSFLLVGEPGLALTFMDIASEAALLSVGLQRQLTKLLRSYGGLRADKRPDILAPVRPTLDFIQRIETPG